MGRTLLPKFPRDQDERLWKYIRVLLLGATDDSDLDDPLLIRPPQQPAAALNNIPNSSSVSLSSMSLNGGGAASVGVNGNNTMATAGVIGPRHMSNNKNTSLSVTPNSLRNKVLIRIHSYVKRLFVSKQFWARIVLICDAMYNCRSHQIEEKLMTA